MANTPPGTLIDVVVLVFARSELKNVVGTDALRTVLNGSQRAMFPDPQTMSLQPVWDLLESQPGFEPEKAIAPMCRLKTWEGQLKVKVQMPAALESLDGPTREKKAFGCNVGDDDLNKLLKPATKDTPRPTTRAIESSNAPKHRVAKRRLGLGIALAIGALGIAAAGISLYLTFGSTNSKVVKLSAADITTEIPVADVRRSGSLIVATLTDPAWLGKPELDRTKQMETTGPKLRAHQANGLMLVDREGKLLGIYRADKGKVSFPKR